MVSKFLNTISPRLFLLTAGLLFISSVTFAKNEYVNKPIFLRDTNINNTNVYLTLRQCIDYAMQHQPALNRSLINVNITQLTNKVNLSGWLPQVNGSGNLIHYFQLGGSGATTVSSTGGGSAATVAPRVANTFIPVATVSQTVFNPSLLYTARSANLLVDAAKEVTDSTKIDLVSTVSKSFYNVLLTLQQINVFKEDTARLGKSLRDAYNQYKGGIVDETDWEEAAITLNTSIAQLKQANENVTPQYAALKQLMGYPPEQQFNVSFDTLQMAHELVTDTLEQLRYEKRIESKELKTQVDLQTETINYYRYAFLPTVSAFFSYSPEFEGSNFSGLFSTSYPSSYVGLSFSIPIFTGFARVNNLKKARLQQELNNWNAIDLKSQIYSQYTAALGNYKYNYFNLQLLKKNVALAKRTYFVVTLQYKQGIVAYLNVITAESNLITAEISYVNALFTVLSNKIDLEKALGDISY